ncbi:hypothetical protein AGLY_000848 [Aphis glycines]|uniref:Nose resistant-to-fluoxetine protein N-terminal domain-containing protein n=1 Tax=Aphis glycines TaxID=307491 RepID=A0A6G0U847_APHGL|nr:hypothetical protein AGLY_000848 [Aphis glycines]
MESYDHAWNEILGFIDYNDRYHRNEVKIGICIPESCTAENLEISLQNELDRVFLPYRVQPKVNVDPMLCSTDKNMYPYDTGYYVIRIGSDILLTCMNLVDPFFYITGFLMYVMIKPELVKRGTGWMQIPMIVFYKYMRILPAYGAMMLLTAFYIPYMFNGPLWASKMWPEAEKCKKFWWTNVLAISNFVDVDDQCLIVGWYISCLV